MVSKMAPLLERNEKFASAFTPVPLGLPSAQVVVVACLDHRVTPEIILELGLGDAPVLRNAGGRVTQAVIDDIAYLAYLGRKMAGGRELTGDAGIEIAIIHHTQCGTSFLADPGFLRDASEGTGVDEQTLAASVVADPHVTVVEDVERLLASPLLPAGMEVSGYVHDLDTGRIATVVEARAKSPENATLTNMPSTGLDACEVPLPKHRRDRSLASAGVEPAHSGGPCLGRSWPVHIRSGQITQDG